MRSLSFIIATGLTLCLAANGFAAGPDQIGTFEGTLKSKGLDLQTGEKLSTKSIVSLTVASDNSTTLTIDGNNFLGRPDNVFGTNTASIIVLGPGPSLITGRLSFKNGSVKGSIEIISLVFPFGISTGKMKLKSTGVSTPSPIQTVFDSTETSIPILDISTTNSTITVSGPTIVTDVNVTLDITHTFDGDLDLTLKSPSGTEVILSTDNGNIADNYTNTIFDDQATQSIVLGIPPFTGAFRPEENLRNFNGEPAGGVWTLIITDDGFPDTGLLNAWGLQINSEPLDLL